MALRSARTPASRRSLALVALPVLLASVAAPVGVANAATIANAATPATTTTPGLERTTLATPSNAAPQLAAAQSLVAAAVNAYDQARANVTSVSEQTSRLQATAVEAEERAAELRAEVTHESAGTLIQVLSSIVGDGESDLDRAAAAADDAAHARELADMTAVALTESITAVEQARADLETAQLEVRRVESQWTARQAADSAIRRSTFTPAYTVDDAKQDRRNRAALRDWHRYLDQLAELGVVPPPAKKLANPDRLPGDLLRVRDTYGDVVPGVAKVDSPDRAAVPVVPAETVRAISEAFRRVGLPDVPGSVAPSAYACGGFLANAWGPAAYTLPADTVNQWRELRTVPRHALQLGDAVVLGTHAEGVEQSGVYLGEDRVIVADIETGTAGVQPLPRKGLFGVKRVPLATTRTYAAPPAGDCGVEPATLELTAPATTSLSTGGTSALVLPVAEGTYTLSATFGVAGALWSSGSHTGLDFAAPTGTPVYAMADGVVTVENPDWAGNLVRINHGGGAESSYAHLDQVVAEPGETVRRGDVIGTVGNRGNSTGPHLHLEVRLDGAAVDPAAVLDVPELPRPTFTNGEIPADELCYATSDGSQLLRCDAAVTYRMMSAAYESSVGTAMCLTDTYRSREGQETLFGVKPGLAATPGTSVHGYGLAVDLCGGVERFGTAEHTWVVRNGPAYGWVHPSWAAAGGSRPEPWHFEFTP